MGLVCTKCKLNIIFNTMDKRFSVAFGRNSFTSEALFVKLI